jgi:Na+/H+-dicarboxylate symporter
MAPDDIQHQEAPPPTLARRWVRLSLSTRILIGLALGVAAGLFLGEVVAPLRLVADAYIRLMRMTVIPYVTVALITGLGQLELAQAKALAVRGGLLLLLFWGLLFLVLASMPLSFPEYESASFFSTSLIEARTPPDLVGLYIPDNPFHSLANSVVPAVVLFSAAVGIALIGIQKKAPLMDGLAVFMQALTRVTRFVVSLTPLGVFAIGAVAAGTMTLAEFERLQVYFVAFFVAAGLLAFGIIPLVVTALTPFRYRDVVGVAKDALLTAFVTNNVFIVLPILVEQGKGLIRRYGLESDDAESYLDVIIPVAFNFPTVGKLLTLLFVPFAAWLSGAPLAPTQYPGFFLAGLVSYFAKAQTALPFLMDLMRVPQDLFQLYIPTTLLNGKLDSLVGAMHLLALGLVGAGAMSGWVTLRAGRVARSLLAAVVGIAAAVGGTTLLLARTVNTTYTRDEALKGMHLPRHVGSARIYGDLGDVELHGGEGRSGLERIKERGAVRVGYNPDRLPFAFFNARGDLVGFDVELATLLAEDLGVGLELVP